MGNREKEQEEQKGNEQQKTILNGIASKAEFVRKMSQTFGYGMPSNAEAKPDTLTAEAENCLLIKNSNSRNSPRENNRKNAENLLPQKKEEPKREVKREKPKEE